MSIFGRRLLQLMCTMVTDLVASRSFALSVVGGA